MGWMTLLFLFLVLAVVATLTGAQPSGAKPASGTRLMSAARVVLVLIGAVLLLVMLRGGFDG